jgi:sigma-B regulation protein RsbU (phosphoserine phosphatase)
MPNRTELMSALDLLSDMNRQFATSLDIQDTLRFALRLITDHVNAEGGSVFLLEQDGHRLACRACTGPVDILGITLDAGQGIVGRSVACNEGVIVRDVSKDPNFQVVVDQKTGFVTRSILCAPMTVKDEHLGAIELVNKRSTDGLFTEADLLLLQTLAASAAMALVNARMSQALVEQERLRRELELAAAIQRNLLPEVRPAPFPVYGVNLPARTVSGDFYDFFTLDDGRIGFCLGDVSGKGMNAALLMSKTASLFRCLGKTIHEPGRLLGTINSEISETASHGMFVTMIAGLLNPADGTVRLSNAGHEPPLLVARDGSRSSLAADAPPLGILPDNAALPEIEVALDGGSLYLFSDGVTEGTTAGGRLGRDGFEAIVTEHRGQPVGERIEHVLRLLRANVENNGDKLHDDITILAIDDRHDD